MYIQTLTGKSIEDLEQLKENIIQDLFKFVGNIPVSDTSAYSLPFSFWKDIQGLILHYEKVDYPIGLYARLCEFFHLDFYDLIDSSDLNLWEGSKKKHLNYFRMVLSEYTGLQETVQLDGILIRGELPSHLLNKGLSFMGFLDEIINFYSQFSRGSSHPYRISMKTIQKKEQQKFSQFKRDTVRKKYIEQDSILTDRYFQEADFIEYPDLMLDRIVIQVYSEEFMTWKKNVSKRVKASKANFLQDAVAESRGFDVQELLSEYDKADVDAHLEMFKDDYNDKFNLMETRSIIESLNLTNKPKVVDRTKNGGALSYYFYEDGCTYWFIASPATKGGPLSLMVSANMQTKVYNRLREVHPEIEEAYIHEYLKDINFIPLGWEKEYLKYEAEELENLRNKAISVYALMLSRLGFSMNMIQRCTLKVSVNQVEVCWNNDLPVDPAGHMMNIMRTYESWGFYASSLDDKTPMLVTKFESEIEPGVIVFKHKHYMKTKACLRQELQFFGELKHPCSFYQEGTKPLDGDSSLIHEQFFIDSERIKRYLYAKAQFHIQRRTEGFADTPDGFDKETFLHGYHKYSEAMKPLDDSGKSRLLRDRVENSYLPRAFRDFELFHAFVLRIKRDGYITRKFFSPKPGMGWGRTMFQNNVMDSPYFEKKSRGKYRLKQFSKNRDLKERYFLNFVEDYWNLVENFSLMGV